MTTERHDYANGTFLVQSYPWGLFHGGAAQCADGTVRRLKRIAQTADTFFSIPASVTVRGKTVAGYVTTETVSGMSTATDDDPTIVRFNAYRYRKNHDLIVARCAQCGAVLDHTEYGWMTVDSLAAASHPVYGERTAPNGHNHYPFAVPTTDAVK